MAVTSAGLQQARKLYQSMETHSSGDRSWLKCPDCDDALEVVNFLRGPLDRDRGIHQPRHYGWMAVCHSCNREWGGFDTREVPSLWVLRDLVEEKPWTPQKQKK